MRLRLAAFAAALAFAVGGLPAGGQIVVDCPPVYDGNWSGTYLSDVSGASGAFEGVVDIDGAGNALGSFASSGTITVSGPFVGVVDCDSLVGMFMPVEVPFEFPFVLTYSPDGRSAAGTYEAVGVDNGTLTFEIAADALSVAVGSVEVFEGGAETSAPPARASSVLAATAPATRVAYVTVSVSEPSRSVLPVQYRLVGVDGAAAGVDYVDDGTVHTVRIPRRATSRTIAVRVYDNGVRDGDRVIEVEIVGTPPGYRAYNAVGTVTVVDDD